MSPDLAARTLQLLENATEIGSVRIREWFSNYIPMAAETPEVWAATRAFFQILAGACPRNNVPICLGGVSRCLHYKARCCKQEYCVACFNSRNESRTDCQGHPQPSACNPGGADARVRALERWAASKALQSPGQAPSARGEGRIPRFSDLHPQHREARSNPRYRSMRWSWKP